MAAFQRAGPADLTQYLPSLEEGERHRWKNRVARVRGLAFPELYPIAGTDALTLSEISVGIALYFSVLKWMCISFFIMAAIAGFEMFLNYYGGAFTDVTYNNLSLGNFGTLPPTIYHGILDAGYSAFFILSLVVLYRRLLRLIPEMDSHNLTSADYSIMVSEMPINFTDASAYLEHFQQFGEVAEVSVALDNVQIIGLYKERKALAEELARAVGREVRGIGSCCACCNSVQSLQQKLSALEREIMFQKQKKSYDAAAAFVSFQFSKSREKAVDAYRRRHIGHVLCSCCCKPGPKLHKTVPLEVRRAPEPTNIKWENLPVSSSQRCCRKFTTSVMTVILLAIGFGVSFVAIFFKLVIVVNTSCVDFSNILSDITCLIGIARSVSINLASSFSVVLLNLALVAIMSALARREGHHTVTGEEEGIMWKVFSAQAFNTGVVVMCAGLYHMWWMSGSNQLPNFSPNWYTLTGDFITVTMIIQAIVPKLLDLLQFAVWSFRRSSAAKNAVTQDELNEAYTGPEFTLAPRVASVLMTIFVNLMYSGGIPFLLIVCGADLFLTYWTDKIFLLRLARRPQAYDHRMILAALRVLPWAIIVHLFFAVLFFGAQKGTPITIGLSQSIIALIPSSYLVYVAQLSIQQLPSLVAICVISAGLVLWFIVYRMHRIIRSLCCLCCRGAQVEDDGTHNISFHTAVREIRKTGSASYAPPFSDDTQFLTSGRSMYMHTPMQQMPGAAPPMPVPPGVRTPQPPGVPGYYPPGAVVQSVAVAPQ